MTEGATKVASEVVAGLKASPIVLFVLLLNVGFLVAGSIYLSNMEQHRTQNIKEYLELLEKCYQRSTGSLLTPGDSL